MNKILLLLIVLFLTSSCVSVHTVRIHRNSKVVYTGNGVGMTPDCKKHCKIKHDTKIYYKHR